MLAHALLLSLPGSSAVSGPGQVRFFDTEIAALQQDLGMLKEMMTLLEMP